MAKQENGTTFLVTQTEQSGSGHPITYTLDTDQEIPPGEILVTRGCNLETARQIARAALLDNSIANTAQMTQDAARGEGLRDYRHPLHGRSPHSLRRMKRNAP